jgi:tripartite-type tricarboxylate transporter receptor subunit TctC
MSLQWIIRVIAVVALAAAPFTSPAQDFPTRPITLVAPYPPGSATDNVTRPLAVALQEILGSPVIENRAGAQGVIGAEFVARSKPDGYTLLVASTTMFAGTSLVKNLPYDPIKSFQPVSGIGSTSMMFMVRTESPIKTIADLVQAVVDGLARVDALEDRELVLVLATFPAQPEAT